MQPALGVRFCREYALEVGEVSLRFLVKICDRRNTKRDMVRPGWSENCSSDLSHACYLSAESYQLQVPSGKSLVSWGLRQLNNNLVFFVYFGMVQTILEVLQSEFLT